MKRTLYKVVIADDEGKIINLIRNLIDWESLPLQLAGTAQDGISAMELIQEVVPDILILDIRMPGYNGIELISRIRNVLPHLSFVIVSGYKHFEYAHNAIKFGVDNYLLKPVKKDELNDTLRKIIQKKSGSHEIAYKSTRDNGDQLLKELLRGDQEIRERVGRQFTEKNHALLLIKNDLNTDQLSDNTEVLLTRKSLPLIEKVFADTGINHLIGEEDKRFYILLNYGEREEKFIRNHVFTLLERHLELREIFPGLTTAAAISSPFMTLDGCAGAKILVDDLIYNRFVFGTGKMLDESHIIPSGIERREILTPQVRAELEKRLEILNDNKVRELLDDLQSSICESCTVPGKVIFELAENLLDLIAYNMERFFGLEDSDREKIRQWGKIITIQGTPESLFSRLKSLTHELIEEKRLLGSNREELPIREAKEYINENFFRNISLEDVSDAIGRNPSYLSSLFKKRTGIGFLEYLTQVRMEEAKELLSDKTRSIADTAGEVGYRDTKHFARQFKKIVGLSPTEYRKIYY
ncbi:MAG: response regulator [Spirochaetales bacterium]|nr:response regulator [Spirochaetales bacterium]